VHSLKTTNARRTSLVGVRANTSWNSDGSATEPDVVTWPPGSVPRGTVAHLEERLSILYFFKYPDPIQRRSIALEMFGMSTERKKYS